MPSSWPTAPDLLTRCRPLLGTFVEITTPEDCDEAVEAAFAAIAHVHDRMSFHQADSDLACIRKARIGELIAVDRATVDVFRTARALHVATGGLFDVGVGRHLVASGFLPGDQIGPLEHYDGTTADILIEDDVHIRLRRRILVDLGGIAKGYAVDRAVEVLTAHEVPCGLVNAGGDLRAFGPTDWTIGLRDADDVVRLQMGIRDCAVASSSNLHGRRLMGGVSCTPHIERNGRSILAEGRMTVIAERCVIADAMTKVAMIDPLLANNILAEFKGQVVPNPSPVVID